jgi:hypothetical protein
MPNVTPPLRPTARRTVRWCRAPRNPQPLGSPYAQVSGIKASAILRHVALIPRSTIALLLLRHSTPITALKHYTRAQKESIEAALKQVEEMAAKADETLR